MVRSNFVELELLVQNGYQIHKLLIIILFKINSIVQMVANGYSQPAGTAKMAINSHLAGK
jgi:hypothetical protein